LFDRKAYFKAYYQAKKDKIKAAAARRRAEKPDECRAAVEAWHKDPANADRKRVYAREVVAKSEAFKRAQQRYRELHPGVQQACVMRRRAAKLHRTPAWLTKDDLVLMRDIYRFAAVLTDASGIPYEVDHEIPLQGEVVSGFHVPANLRIVTRRENRSKSNRFEI
jgi:hypothetical protein